MDTTMGNGSHVIAALQRGRRAIWIERVAGLHDAAVRHLETVCGWDYCQMMA